MNTKSPSYGKLCSLFYDATKKFASDDEVAFYASFVQQGHDRILEAMSGSGRLQIPLLQRGYLVDGVDNSSVMLDRCRQRCAQLQLTPILYEQSLENLALPHIYTTVTIAVGSFQLIIDRKNALQALKNIHTHMHEGGNLLIDIFVPDTTMETNSTSIARIDQHTIIRLTTHYVFHEQEKIADAFCFYERIVDGMIQEQENELIQVTWYSDNELTELLKKAGFNVVKIYDETFRKTSKSRVIHAQSLI